MTQEEIENQALKCINLAKNLEDTFTSFDDKTAYKIAIMAAIKDAYMLGFSDAQSQIQFIDKQEIEKP
jgi:hypothetical protein